MGYRLKVTRMEPNADYEAQMHAYEADRNSAMLRGTLLPMNADAFGPQREVEIATLDTMLTDAEWESVKRAVVTHWQTETGKDKA